MRPCAECRMDGELVRLSTRTKCGRSDRIASGITQRLLHPRALDRLGKDRSEGLRRDRPHLVEWRSTGCGHERRGHEDASLRPMRI
jgi:hypothetical protein